MTATIIDGAALARDYRAALANRAAAIVAAGGSVRLDALLVDHGDNAARVYADNQARTCQSLGIEYRLHRVTSGATFDDVAGRVLLLSAQDDVSAIMVHLPLPDGVDAYAVQRLIAPEKDVEGVNPANIGNVVYGRSSLAPCTGLAVIKMIQSVAQHAGLGQHTGLAHTPHTPLLRGKVAVVVGAGDVVGKPIAVLLMRQEATVISCNKWTPGLAGITRSADILVAAAGVPHLVTRDMVKPGAIVIDVGVNRVPGPAPDFKPKTVGDVDFDAVREVASFISPVPGGVGPMTVAMLLHNVVEAAERRFPRRAPA
jgi:methylenetetrahydrofolate dehydrogenase (NADP+)/methenyltetrahydrofolate cyclohydrolase